VLAGCVAVLLGGGAQGCDLPQPPADPPALSALELIEGGHDLRVKAALTPVSEADPSNAMAAWLLSKALSGLGELDRALVLAERAVALDGEDAAYHVQLGAVLGLLAEKASIFKQLGLARRTRKELEAGVALDPRNLDGLYALMLYYFSAPSFLGGDKGKATDLAARIGAIDATHGLLARASLAHEQRDAAAELDFSLRAVALDAGSSTISTGRSLFIRHWRRSAASWWNLIPAGLTGGVHWPRCMWQITVGPNWIRFCMGASSSIRRISRRTIRRLRRWCGRRSACRRRRSIWKSTCRSRPKAANPRMPWRAGSLLPY
jgi:hypothetical protein